MRIAALKTTLFLFVSLASARVPEEPLRKVDFQPPPGAAVPMGLSFIDEAGRPARLGEILGGRPALLTLGYGDCPALCSIVLNGVVRALRPLGRSAGKDFSLVTVSIDPRETPERSARLRRTYLKRYRRAGADWRFLTGDEEAVSALASAVGFRYAPDGAGGFAHAAGLLVLAPDGRVARTLYGVEFAPRDVRLALVEAAEGKGASPAEKLLLYCYDYNPVEGRYGPIIVGGLRAGAAAALGGLGLLVAVLLRRERRRIPG